MISERGQCWVLKPLCIWPQKGMLNILKPDIWGDLSLRLYWCQMTCPQDEVFIRKIQPWFNSLKDISACVLFWTYV